jgi:hypothetical protein
MKIWNKEVNRKYEKDMKEWWKEDTNNEGKEETKLNEGKERETWRNEEWFFRLSYTSLNQIQASV